MPEPVQQATPEELEAQRLQGQIERQNIDASLEHGNLDNDGPAPVGFSGERPGEILDDAVPTDVQLTDDELREQQLEARANAVDRGVAPKARTEAEPQPQPQPVEHAAPEAGVTAPAAETETTTPEASDSSPPEPPLVFRDGQYYGKTVVNGEEVEMPYSHIVAEAQKSKAATQRWQRTSRREQELAEREAEIARREAELQQQLPTQGVAGSESQPVPPAEGVQQPVITEDLLEKGLYENDPEAKAKLLELWNARQSQPAPAQPAQPAISPADVPRIVDFELERKAALDRMRTSEVYGPLYDNDLFAERVAAHANQLETSDPGLGPGYYIENSFELAKRDFDQIAQLAAGQDQQRQVHSQQPQQPVAPVTDPKLAAKQQHASNTLAAAASARAPQVIPQFVDEESPAAIKARMKAEREAY